LNERIRELWSQAGGQYNSGNQHTWPEYTIDDPKKFAELIVQDNIQTLRGNGYDDAAQVLQDIHFGIEDPV
jgi:DNA polymerase/3'-5' exonuclease PolX